MGKSHRPRPGRGRILGLTGITIESAVSAYTGKPFCTVRSTSEEGDVMVGQLKVEQVRAMALGWLETAVAAENDAVVFTMLCRDIGLDELAALQFIVGMRSVRAGGDFLVPPDPGPHPEVDG